MGLPWDAQQKIYTAFCGLGFVLAYIPLYWHLEAWNVGAVLWIFWSGTACLIRFINGIIWSDNTTNCAPVWCDIITRFLQAQPIGTTIASALINYRLYRLTRLNQTITTREDKRKMAIRELSVGFGVPVIFMGTYWFVQGHRFDILEGVGCIQATPLTFVWIFTYGIWPTFIATVSGTFGVMTIIAFMRHRKEIDAAVSASHRSLTSYRFFRLMVFASVDVLFLFPLTLFLLFDVITSQSMYPWNGLADLHFGFSNVLQIPAESWRSTQASIIQTLLPPGTAIGSALVFFAFFGLAQEARTHYRKAFTALRQKCGCLSVRRRGGREKLASAPPRPAGGLSHLTMPSFVQRIPGAVCPPKARHTSLSSLFTDTVTVEGRSVSDADLAACDPEKTLPPLPAGADYDDDAPHWPPGLAPRAWLDSAPATPDSRLTRPPSHSFHGPRSVTSTMNTLYAV